MEILKVPGQKGAVLKRQSKSDATGVNVFKKSFQLQSLWNKLFRDALTQLDEVSRRETWCERWLMPKAPQQIYELSATEAGNIIGVIKERLLVGFPCDDGNNRAA